MFYYNEDGEKIVDSEKLECMNTCGATSNIYRLSKTKILKTYLEPVSNTNRIDKNLFEILQNINSEYMVKIYELLKNNPSNELIDGYIAKYYKPYSIDILTDDVNYILDNIRYIEILFDCLAGYGIRVDDVKPDNSILQKNKIILIDPDSYEFVNCSLDSIKKMNKKTLHKFICSLFIKKMIINRIPVNKIQMLKMEIESDSEVSYQLSKKFKTYKRALDYFNSRK